MSASGSRPLGPVSTWWPTIGHYRAVVVAVALATAAVVWRRADLLVLAAPMAVVACWSTVTRPRTDPAISDQLVDSTVREGQATTWRVRFAADAATEHVVALLHPGRWYVTRPRTGVLTSSASGPVIDLEFAVRSIRWGHHRLGPMTIAATSSWGAFRWMDTIPDVGLTALPLPAVFDSNTALRRATGLVGLNQSPRPGDGSEFAGIRPFQVGDRLRRIHWPRSMRAGTLHVTSTWADQDSHVVIVVDAIDDLGVSEGIDGLASSLDVTVRAAGAIAEYYVQRGDRVSLRVLGSTSNPIPASTGRAHLRRILDALAMIPADSIRLGLGRRDRFAVPADALAIMLSPLISPVALERAVTLARHGLTVVVVDTLPDHIVDDDDALTALAWRIRVLERRREMRIVQEIGVPVVHWNGPGSLDQFLRDAARRATAPRLTVR